MQFRYGGGVVTIEPSGLAFQFLSNDMDSALFTLTDAPFLCPDDTIALYANINNGRVIFANDMENTPTLPCPAVLT